MKRDDKTHKNLDVWKEAMTLAKRIYKLTADFQKEETYGLVSQIRRAAVLISSNIAEGASRSSNKKNAARSDKALKSQISMNLLSVIDHTLRIQ